MAAMWSVVARRQGKWGFGQLGRFVMLRIVAPLALSLFMCLGYGTAAGDTAKFSTLFRFNGADGQGPNSQLISPGVLFFGATLTGGTAGDGTVFMFNARTGKEAVLHSFEGAADGGYLYGGVVYENGILYGGTETGGTGDAGVVFAVNSMTGTETTLHAFTGEPDGNAVTGALILDNGTLYGTTSYGGAANDGTIFQINPVSGAYKILYNFAGAPDGKYPIAGVVLENGVLYGTTRDGGAGNDSGTVFKFDLSTDTESVLHSFAAGADGSGPEAALLARGNKLYGTTVGGGLHSHGIVFRVDALTGTEKVLHDFSGKDGDYPFLAPLIEKGGLLYGSTFSTVYEMDPETGSKKTLHRHLQQASGLVMRDGTLYGTTAFGGHSGDGTIFRVAP
jgi:uncharacterized repeat protein (TIGR03803 family)